MDNRKNIIYKFSPSIAWQIEQSEQVVYILNKKNNNFLYFTGVSKDIWMNINTKKTVGDIVNLISKIYKVEKEIVEKDVNEFLLDLYSEGVILIDE